MLNDIFHVLKIFLVVCIHSIGINILFKKTESSAQNVLTFIIMADDSANSIHTSLQRLFKHVVFENNYAA